MFLIFFTARHRLVADHVTVHSVDASGEIAREEHADFCVQEDSLNGSGATRSILVQFTLRGSLFGRKRVRCTHSHKLSSFYWFTVTARIRMHSLFKMQLIWRRKNRRHCRQCPTWMSCFRLLCFCLFPVLRLEHQHHYMYLISGLLMTSSLVGGFHHISVGFIKKNHVVQPLIYTTL